MGIERARVVEVHSKSSATARVCSGYLVADNLVLTAGGHGPAEVRPASTAVWCSASRVWAAASGDVPTPGPVGSAPDPSPPWPPTRPSWSG